jgi:hypothetical protein
VNWRRLIQAGSKLSQARPSRAQLKTIKGKPLDFLVRIETFQGVAPTRLAPKGLSLHSPRSQTGAAPAPSRRGASPKPTWRQPQTDVAPTPNLCQLFPIATHCRFQPFQGLGHSRKRHRALDLAASARFRRKHIRQQLCSRSIFSAPVRFVARSASLDAPSLSDHCQYVGRLPI